MIALPLFSNLPFLCLFRRRFPVSEQSLSCFYIIHGMTFKVNASNFPQSFYRVKLSFILAHFLQIPANRRKSGVDKQEFSAKGDWENFPR